MQIRDLQGAVHDLAREKGWYDDVRDASDPIWIAARLSLIHSEVSEALECARDGELESRTGITGKPCGLPSELADIVIRTLDLAGSIGIDLESEIMAKYEFNTTRPRKHGRVF